ncbi:MAG: NAD-glutamate dehydrogenase, partial [Steroidobacteraceae bacterium]|nr:NAD-glutamate dehydrogenase [Steroidobacteraceae bacterium]
ATACAALQRELEQALADVRVAVRDWHAMRAKVRMLAAALVAAPPRRSAAEDIQEARALLEWMEAQHFVFLGYRYYRLRRGRHRDYLLPDDASGLGILARRRGSRQRSSVNVLTGGMRALARDHSVLVITKANALSTVHRGSYLDYVAVKDFDAAGEPRGEHRFLGLWTSTAYFASPADIPVLRRKVRQVIDFFGLDPASHDGKAVLAVLETYPRDELFQASVPELIDIVRGVVNLYERRKTRLLVRRDPFGRFYSCMVYVPRDRYTTDVRQRIERLILTRFGGTTLESQVQISDASHARVHVVVRVPDPTAPTPNLAAIEAALAAEVTTWNDRLRAALQSRYAPAQALALAQRYAQTFPVAYQEDIAPQSALDDIADLERLRDEPQRLCVKLHRPLGAPAARVNLKIVKLGAPIPISDLLPTMENFGLRVLAERPYELQWPEGGGACVQDFELEHRAGSALDVAAIERRFTDAFLQVWRGDIENDGLQRLLIGAGLSAREITMLRAYCRYLLQTGLP